MLQLPEGGFSHSFILAKYFIVWWYSFFNIQHHVFSKSNMWIAWKKKMNVVVVVNDETKSVNQSWSSEIWIIVKGISMWFSWNTLRKWNYRLFTKKGLDLFVGSTWTASRAKWPMIAFLLLNWIKYCLDIYFYSGFTLIYPWLLTHLHFAF